jgi:pimeloyl-ACP methyl ester carboxylesterase
MMTHRRLASTVAGLFLGACSDPSSADEAETGGTGSTTADSSTSDGGTEGTDGDETGQAACLNPDPFARPFEVDPADYPFRSCSFSTAYGNIHYFDEGPQDAENTIVVVHGNPTWSFLYRNIAEAMLEDGHRVVALDHLGLGMSDIPATSEYDYRPRSHAQHLEDLVVALDLQNVTLVVQDWGGPIGLGMATRQPDRISSILIMNTWAWSVDADDPGPYHEIISWTQDAKTWAAASPTVFCDLLFPGQSELTAAEADPSRGPLYERVLDAYLSPAIDTSTGEFRTSEPCAAMQIFAESISDDDAYQGEVEARLDTLRGKPYSLLFGLSDQLFGALRCDTDSDSPCPGQSTCSCDDGLLPARVTGGCDDPMASAYHVCKQPDGSIIDPYADRFVELLGAESLVERDTVPDADHMIQEWAPERVVEALRTLIAQETP